MIIMLTHGSANPNPSIQTLPNNGAGYYDRYSSIQIILLYILSQSIAAEHSVRVNVYQFE